MNKRVLVLSTLYPNATAPRFGTFVEASMKALAATTDWQPVVINPIPAPPVALGRYAALREIAGTSGIEAGVEVHRPPFRMVPKFGARSNPVRISDAVLPLVRQLNEATPFSCVDAQFFWPDGPAAARIASALDLPLSIKARGADIHYWGGKAFARDLMLQAAGRAKGLLAVSDALREDMVAMGMERESITLHQTGLDRDRFRPHDHDGLRRQLSEALGIALPAAAPLLASVGALIERKGQRFVIDALPLLGDAHLVLVGEGADEAALRTQVEQAELGDRVHFLGNVSHDILPLILSAADVMVLPSSSEGLANAWVEALACGTPLVITDVGGARDVLSDPVSGEFAERDADSIAKAVRKVLAREQDRTAVAQTVDRFSWSANAAKLAAHYDALTG